MASASIRPPAVAGLFYPDDARVLRVQISGLMAAAPPPDLMLPPKALIVPHAGFIYSGPIAAAAYRLLTSLRAQITRVILIGPTHRMAVRGIALPAAQAFATPLGTVPVSRIDWHTLQSNPHVLVDDAPHAREHSLEVQLPFLQTVLDGFELVPLLAGDVAPDVVAALLETLWGGPETLLLVSSDLSHYHPYETARLADRRSVEQVLNLGGPLNHEQACGATPINALLEVARRQGLQPHLLDLRNSGDTAGDRGSVVGYAAIAFTGNEPHANRLTH